MGPTWSFLLMFESRVERDTHFVALRHSMTTCIPRVDGLSTDPRGRGVTPKDSGNHKGNSFFPFYDMGFSILMNQGIP